MGITLTKCPSWVTKGDQVPIVWVIKCPSWVVKYGQVPNVGDQVPNVSDQVPNVSDEVPNVVVKCMVKCPTIKSLRLLW